MQASIFFPFLVALIATAIATPIAIIAFKKLKIVDDPKKHKHPAIIHKIPIPRGGGVPLLLGVIVAGLFFLPITNITIALFIAALIAVIVGVIDDKYDISPYIRFIANFICAIIVISSGVSIDYITNPLGGILQLNTAIFSLNGIGIPLQITFGNIVALIWIVWVMNMLNWSKGVDGQMPGIVAISAIVIGILSFRITVPVENEQIAGTLSFIIAGSAIGFLLYNFYPAKIFPGYSATAIYLLLSAVSILSGAKLATAILVMGVPMIDGVFTIARRISQGKSPFRHDKKHLHHLLLRMGWSQRQIALFYWGISAILGAISLFLSSQGKFFAIIMLVVIVGGGLLFLHLFLRNDETLKSS